MWFFVKWFSWRKISHFSIFTFHKWAQSSNKEWYLSLLCLLGSITSVFPSGFDWKFLDRGDWGVTNDRFWNNGGLAKLWREVPQKTAQNAQILENIVRILEKISKKWLIVGFFYFSGFNTFLEFKSSESLRRWLKTIYPLLKQGA